MNKKKGSHLLIFELGWSRDPANVTVIRFASRTGAVSGVAEDGMALDLFSLFVSEELFEKIVEETNRYAQQCILAKPDPKWKETTLAEMKAYFGLFIYFGIHKLSKTRLFWSSDSALDIPFVKRVMPRERFDKLTQYLHVNNNKNAIPRGHANHGKLFKIRPLMPPSEMSIGKKKFKC